MTASTVTVSPPPRATRLEVGLQRRFGVVADAVACEVPHSSQRLVACLAIHGVPLSRDAVAAQLWSNVTGDRAAAALRTALWRLGPLARRLVDAGQGRLALTRGVVVDFRATARRAEAILSGEGVTGDVAVLRDAGDLLPDWYDDWVIIERERFRQLRIDALETLCAQLSAGGEYSHATDAGLAAIVAEPLREQAHRALIRAHLAAGNPGEARRQYRLLRQLLARELGVSPSPVTDALLAPIRLW